MTATYQGGVICVAEIVNLSARSKASVKAIKNFSHYNYALHRC